MERMFHQLERTFHRLECTFHRLERKLHHRENTFIALCYNNLSTMFQLCCNNVFFWTYKPPFSEGVPPPQTDALAMLNAMR